MSQSHIDMQSEDTFDVRGIFRKKNSFCGCMYLKHFKALKASIKSLIKCLLHAQNAREK